MTMCSSTIVAVKNQWLHQQVEVEHPTPESLRGRAIYQALPAASIVQMSIPEPVALSGDELYLVDFHRLTVLFAMLQAQRTQGETQQAELLEFFAQIILAKPCELYVGFSQGEPCAAAILTEHKHAWLISDCIIVANERFTQQQDLIDAIVTLKSSQGSLPDTLWVERLAD